MRHQAHRRDLQQCGDHDPGHRNTVDDLIRQNGHQNQYRDKQDGSLQAKKQPVKNADLWQQLDKLCETHQVSWHWVKAHAGHPENERADGLANRAIEELPT